MIAVLLVCVIAATLLVERGARRRYAALSAALATATEDLAEARAERDEAFIERNAAIDRVQWVPLSSVELSRLAKTGCKDCFGAGYSENASGRAVCACVAKKMSADRKYGFSGATPVRLAVPSDNLPEQKLRSVERN